MLASASLWVCPHVTAPLLSLVELFFLAPPDLPWEVGGSGARTPEQSGLDG